MSALLAEDRIDDLVGRLEVPASAVVLEEDLGKSNLIFQSYLLEEWCVEFFALGVEVEERP